MAILYDAQLVPSKNELLQAWVPTQVWYPTTGSHVDVIATYRFDDPAGEVGLETFIVQVAPGVLLQVPLTYRGAPLAGAEDHLVTTMQHSVLGQRWVYDAVADPVYVQELVRTILSGGQEAEQFVSEDGKLTPATSAVLQARVRGSGQRGQAVDLAEMPFSQAHVWHDTEASEVALGDYVIIVQRHLNTSLVPPHSLPYLRGEWDEHGPHLLAMVEVEMLTEAA